ncbi:MAG: hypothetical protein RRB22_09450 [Gammaproteobacteria bacterium]|nr:hypothetical protein [Gammaproteobacteria bacterium]
MSIACLQLLCRVCLLFAGLVAVITPGWADSAAMRDTLDSDGDGLTDLEEARIYKTDSQFADTDTDGLADGLEVNEYWTLPLVADTDGDGYLDGVEVRLGSDPTEAGSRPDPQDPRYNDLDGDGLTNHEERELGSDPQRVDSDFDGVGDFVEVRRYMTSPTLVDSDGDGAWDGEEVAAGTDPANPDSRPTAPQ